jgi:hypothetical protein
LEKKNHPKKKQQQQHYQNMKNMKGKRKFLQLFVELKMELTYDKVSGLMSKIKRGVFGVLLCCCHNSFQFSHTTHTKPAKNDDKSTLKSDELKGKLFSVFHFLINI